MKLALKIALNLNRISIFIPSNRKRKTMNTVASIPIDEGRVKGTVNPASIIGRRINDRGVRDDYNKDIPITQCLQVKSCNKKTVCLTTVEKDNLLTKLPPGRYKDAYNTMTENMHYRKLTPIECERLQTFEDNYTLIGLFDGIEKPISNTQRYKALGNSWTVEVISHIFSHMELS